MVNKHYKKVISYFAKKASDYDLVDKQLYWSLSDELLKKIIGKKIVDNFSRKKAMIMDAGTGTGRWSLILYNLFKKKGVKTYFDLVDITPQMLEEAKRKIKKNHLTQEMKIHVNNIENLSGFKNDSYDIAISFYNVLSFVEKPRKAIGEIYKKLRGGGLYASVVSNKYHAYFFNILTDQGAEISKINASSKVKFNKKMPYIHCFTPLQIKSIYSDAGFRDVEVIGFPNFIYPNIEETYIVGQSTFHRNILKSKKNFQKIIDIEYKECFNPEAAARGNTLLVIGKK